MDILFRSTPAVVGTFPKNPTPAEDAEYEPQPGPVRPTIGWSTIAIAMVIGKP